MTTTTDDRTSSLRRQAKHDPEAKARLDREADRAPMLFREGMRLSQRAINDETREVEFVAATERPVPTYFGPEVLRCTSEAIDLTRWNKNPIAVDSHNYWSTTAIVGSASSTRIEGRQLVITIRFATNERGENAWQLAKDGHLRAVSVGYRPMKWVDLDDGATDGQGESMVTGPARVITQWALLELSVCALPADEDAVRRSFFDHFTQAREEGAMKYPNPSGGQPQQGQADTNQEQRSQPATTQHQAPSALEALKRDIETICPPELAAFGRSLLLQPGMTFAEAQRQLQAEWAKRNNAVGTPEPQDDVTEAQEGSGNQARSLDDIDDKTLSRALGGL